MGAPAFRVGATRLALSAFMLVAGGLLNGCVGDRAADPASDHGAALERMHETCVAEMLRSTCQAGTAAAPAGAQDVVVIAGVGRIDARAYGELRASGDAMCSLGRRACEADWNGPSCRASRALWAGGAPAITP